MEPILKCTNVCKRIKQFRLEGIHFSLEPGYILGIIGENGAGKSTLLQLILGGYQMDTIRTRELKKQYSMEMISNQGCITNMMGDIEVGGYSVRYHSNEAKRLLAYVLHDCPFSMVMTAKENAQIYGKSYDTWKQEVFEKRCQEYGIPLDKPLRNLSKGQQILFQFAFALSYDARLYIMDEPAGNLDVAYHQMFLDVMQELVEDGTKSVIYVTHQLEDLEQIGDYILWMDEGRQILYGEKEKILDEYRIISGSEKQLRYIEKNAPGTLLVTHIQPHTSEAFLRGNGGNLPIKLKMRKPTLEELLYYYNQYQSEHHQSLFAEGEAGEEKKDKKANLPDTKNQRKISPQSEAVQENPDYGMEERKYYESPYNGI